jgi:hypothetical protein
MDQNSNVNLQVVQGDFPIKYGPKTLNNPYGSDMKNSGTTMLLVSLTSKASG